VGFNVGGGVIIWGCSIVELSFWFGVSSGVGDDVVVGAGVVVASVGIDVVSGISVWVVEGVSVDVGIWFCVGVEVGAGVWVGFEAKVGVGVVVVGVGVWGGVGVGVIVGAGVWVGEGVGAGVGEGVGAGVEVGAWVGVGAEVGAGVGVGVDVGLGVWVGAGATIIIEPEELSENDKPIWLFFALPEKMAASAPAEIAVICQDTVLELPAVKLPILTDGALTEKWLFWDWRLAVTLDNKL